jgi:hypothetical protein
MNLTTVRALIPFAVVADGAVISKVFLGYTDQTQAVVAVVSYAVLATVALVYYFRTH